MHGRKGWMKSGLMANPGSIDPARLTSDCVRIAVAAALYRLCTAGQNPATATLQLARRAVELVRLHGELKEQHLYPTVRRITAELISLLERGDSSLAGEARSLEDDLDALIERLPVERSGEMPRVQAAFTRFAADVLAQLSQEDAMLGPLLDVALGESERAAMHAAIIDDWTAESLLLVLDTIRPVLSAEEWHSKLRIFETLVPGPLAEALGVLQSRDAEETLLQFEFALRSRAGGSAALLRLARTLAQEPGLAWQIWAEEPATGQILGLARMTSATEANAFVDRLECRFAAAGLPQPTWRYLRPEAALSQASRAPLWA